MRQSQSNNVRKTKEKLILMKDMTKGEKNIEKYITLEKR